MKRSITLILILTIAFILSPLFIFSQDSTSTDSEPQSTQAPANESTNAPTNAPALDFSTLDSDASYEDLYKQFFGSAPKQEKAIKTSVSLILDEKLYPEITLSTDTFSTRFDIIDPKFLLTLKDILKPDYYNRIQTIYNKDQKLPSETLTEIGIEWDFRLSDSVLDISLPYSWRSTILIDLGDTPRTDFDKDIETPFFSGFSNIIYSLNSKSNSTRGRNFSNTNVYLDNHLAIGNLFIDSKFKSDNTTNEQYLCQKLNFNFINDRIFYEFGSFSDKNLVGFQFNNSLYRRFSGNVPKSNEYKFTVNDRAILKIFINGKVKKLKSLYPGNYLIRNLPLIRGLNTVVIKIVNLKRQTLLKDEYLEYSHTELLPFLDHNFRYGVGYIDDYGLGIRVKERLRDYPILYVNHKMGLFPSYKVFSNLTGHLELYAHETQQWTRANFRLGTPIGVLGFNMTSSLVQEFLGSEYGTKFSHVYSDPEFFLKSFSFDISFKDAFYKSMSLSPAEEFVMGSESLQSELSIYMQNPFLLLFKGTALSNLKKQNIFTLLFSTSFPLRNFVQLNSRLVLSHKQMGSSAINDVSYFFNIQYNFSNPKLSGNASVNNGQQIILNSDAQDIGLIENIPLITSFTPDNFKLGTAFENGDQKHRIEYDYTTAADNLKYGFANVSNRGMFNFNYRKASTFAENYISSDFYVNSAFVFTNTSFSFSEPIANKNFTLVDLHPGLFFTPVSVGTSKSDQIGPMIIPAIMAFQPNFYNIKTDGQLPANVELKKSSVSFFADYGKATYVKLGQNAPSVVIGKVLDKKENPYKYQYGNITDGTEIHEFFCGKRGDFQIQLYPGKTYTLTLVRFPDISHTFTITDQPVRVVNLGKILVGEDQTKRRAKKKFKKTKAKKSFFTLKDKKVEKKQTPDDADSKRPTINMFLDKLPTIKAVSKTTSLLTVPITVSDNTRTTFDIISPIEATKWVFSPTFNIVLKFNGPAEFKVNDYTYITNRDNEFHYFFSLKKGLNILKIQLSTSNIKEYNVFYVDSHDDLKGHWAESSAAQLKYMSILPNVPTFSPKIEATTTDIAELLSKTFKFNDIWDTLISSKYYSGLETSGNVLEESISQCLDLGIFEPLNGEPYAERKLSKADIVKYSVLSQQLELFYNALIKPYSYRKVTKYEFSSILYKLFNLNSISGLVSVETALPTDITDDNFFYNQIRSLYHFGVFTNPTLKFNGDDFISLSDALYYFIKLYKELSILTVTPNISIPYQDIESIEGYKPFIQLGVYFRLINPSTSFHPNKLITKDILIALISKTLPVQEKISTLIKEGFESLDKTKYKKRGKRKKGRPNP